MVLQDGTHLFLPRLDLLIKRYKRSLQPLKITDVEKVENILGLYNIKMVEVPKAPQKMGRSQSFIVDTSIGKVMFKRYKPSVALPAVIHEHSILRYLANTGFPAVKLVSSLSGETFVQRNGKIYALFIYLEGYNHYTDYLLFPKQVRSFISTAGKALAALHLKLRDFVPEGFNPNGFKSFTGERWRDIAWYTNKLTQCKEQIRTSKPEANAQSPIAKELVERATWIHETLYQLDDVLNSAELPRLIIHGDYGPNNLLFKSGSPAVVIDFEIARLDWRITDLARSISRFTINRFGFDSAKMEILFGSYHDRYPISIDEIRLIPSVWMFLLLRSIILGWHSSCISNTNTWDVAIRYRLAQVDWIIKNREKMGVILESIV